MIANRPAGAVRRHRIAPPIVWVAPRWAAHVARRYIGSYAAVASLALLIHHLTSVDDGPTLWRGLSTGCLISLCVLLTSLVIPLPDVLLAAVLRRATTNAYDDGDSLLSSVRHLSGPRSTAAATAAAFRSGQRFEVSVARALKSRAALEVFTDAYRGRYVHRLVVETVLGHPCADPVSRGALPLNALRYAHTDAYYPDMSKDEHAAATAMRCVHVSVDEGRSALSRAGADRNVKLLTAHAALRCADLTDPTRLDGPVRVRLLNDIADAVAAMTPEGRTVLEAMFGDDEPAWRFCDLDGRCTCPTEPALFDLLAAASAAGQAAAR